MARLLVLIPIVLEMASVLLVGRLAGFWIALGGILAGFAVGGLLIRRLGRALIANVDLAARSGQSPTGPLLRAACLMAAAILFITPGFLSDLIALLLLIPGSRGLMAAQVWQRMRWPAGARAPHPGAPPHQTYSSAPPHQTYPGAPPHRPAGPPPVIEGDFTDLTAAPTPPRREE